MFALRICDGTQREPPSAEAHRCLPALVSRREGRLMSLLVDLLLIVGVALFFGACFTYAQLSDRMVSGR